MKHRTPKPSREYERNRKRVWRAAHPCNDAFLNLKTSARKRGIEVRMTLAEFETWCAETDYLTLKGVGADDMTCDRIKGELPYQAGNLQLLKNRDNAAKSWNDGSRGAMPMTGSIDPAEEQPW